MKDHEQRLPALRADALGIFRAALAGCDVDRAFERHLRFAGKELVRQVSPSLPPRTQSLADIKRVQVIAFGKAAVPMLDALMRRLPPKLRVDGVCSTPELPEKRHKHVRYFQGSHPLPNEDSLEAAKAAVDLLEGAGGSTFVFFLISGGGSSLFELPRDPSIPLDDVRAFYETLVLSGADIAEVNTVRKYFSAVKGGRLALAAPAAEKLTLLIADVPMKDLGIVASSPTLPDHSTWADCEAVLDRRGLMGRFPATVRSYFCRLRAHPPAPAATPERSEVDVLLSNHDLVSAARDHARALGYKVWIDNACDNWEYRRASSYLLTQFRAHREAGLGNGDGRVCLLSSGEVTVEIAGAMHGCGGRNQQFALQSAIELEGSPEPVIVLSAGSDGQDGNSPAAGAVADPTTVERARRFGFEPAKSLARFNTCPLFTALGDAVVTGPTGNNLRDLRVLLTGG